MHTERAWGHPAVQHDHLDFASFACLHKAGPELGFHYANQARTDKVEPCTYDPRQIEGKVNYCRYLACALLRQGLSRCCCAANNYGLIGKQFMKSLNERPGSIELAHG